MNLKNNSGMIDRIRQDSKLKSGEKLIICLNRSCGSMVEDACLLTTEGKVQNVFWTTDSSGVQADEASIQLVKGGPDIVVFHESRPSSRDGRPNGIRVHHDELDFPCVVFCNSGKERLTVDGEWVEPGEYTAVQEVDINSPEVRKAMKEFMNSPEVREGIEEARRAYKEKKKREEKA